MKYLVLNIIILFPILSYCQSIDNLVMSNLSLEHEPFVFSADIAKIKNKLAKAPRYNEPDGKWIKTKLPDANGQYYNVEIAEAPVVGQKIYAKYPENRSYKVRGISDKRIFGRLSITNEGISAMLMTPDGSTYIEPIAGTQHRAYRYDKKSASYGCGTDHAKHTPESKSEFRSSTGETERKYTIAIACTGEFSNKRNNNLSNINADITTYLTFLNTIYERDLAITFELTDDNDDIIFFNPNTDGLNPSNTSTQLNSAQSVISSTIGSNNYDIGHVFHELPAPNNGWTGAGVASLGIVCANSSKARGWSGCGGPYPNAFWMDIFAHEVGHQFNATHTFYGTSANCGGSQRSVGNGVEPGSGNSLMSYEGICFANGSCQNQNITPESSFIYFHSHSIDQILTFVNGATCFSSTPTNNTPPTITMPADKTIPKGTPFFLDAIVIDPDGDPMLLAWEEVDTDNLTLSCPNGDPDDAATSTTAPLFRAFDPSASGSLRYFPQLSDILNDTQTKGEILPQVGRGIDMRFIARGTDADGISGVSYEDMLITVAGNAGPFEVITGSAPTGYQAGASVPIQWSVNNTNIAPVSCSNVNILFSTDGGQNFNITLASNTPNDGTHTVTMPSIAVANGRIKVEAVDNIFFAINKGDISIISDCNPTSSNIVNDEDLTADAGDPILDLDLTIGNPLTQISSTLNGADPQSNLNGNNNGSCIAFTNNPRYETYLLTVSETDTYTFSSSGSFTRVLNLYQDEFNPAAGTCQNWIASNFSFSPFVVSNPYSIVLNEGDIIDLKVSAFNTSDSGNYIVDISSNGNGQLIESALPTGYGYKYVIYNNANTIIDIQDDPDLSDDNIFSGDVYTLKVLVTLTSNDLSSYISQSFTSLQNDLNNGTVCGMLSSNDKIITINGCTPGMQLVTSPLDNGGTGTLRYKIDNACPGDIIQFSSSLANSTILLNSELSIDSDINISGLGGNNFKLSGNNSNRILSISEGVNIEISGLHLINGFSATNGGAFINEGSVTLDNVTLQGNISGSAPAAFTNNGTVIISETVNIED